MAEPQRIGVPLVEENLGLQPPTAPPMRLGVFVQRVWSLLFGRRGNMLRALYANNGGALGIAPIPLTDMKLIFSGAIISDAWQPLGAFADVISYELNGDGIINTLCEGSVDGATAICKQAAQGISVYGAGGDDFTGGFCGVLHARVKAIRFPGLSGCANVQGCIAAYAYIDN